MTFNKRQINDDIFTEKIEAMGRSIELGFNGEVHLHETADGQKVWMPAATHDLYLGLESATAVAYDPDSSHSPTDNSLRNALAGLATGVVDAFTKTETSVVKTLAEPAHLTATIVKADDRQIAWGWASVSTVDGALYEDLQGHTIAPSEMEGMADSFMLSVRTAKAMHEGGQIGEVIHSFPLTKALGEALGITSTYEGWVIAMKIHDEEIWKRVKTGELQAFSIGGVGKLEEYDAQ